MSEEVAPAPVAAPAEVSAAPAPAAPAPEAAPAAFDWNSWDGSVDSLPEESRDVGARLQDRFQSQFDEKQSELQDLRSIYTALLNDDEDPRVGSLQKELEQARSLLEGEKSRTSEIQAQYDQLSEISTKNFVDRFWSVHDHIRQDDEKLDRFITLLDSNVKGGAWDAYVAAKLLELPEDSFKVAWEAKQEGVPDEYAYRLGEAHSQMNLTEETVKEVKKEAVKAAKAAVSEPRPAAKITNGAVTSSRPQVAERGMDEAKTLDEMRDMAARRALRLFAGGKR